MTKTRWTRKGENSFSNGKATNKTTPSNIKPYFLISRYLQHYSSLILKTNSSTNKSYKREDVEKLLRRLTLTGTSRTLSSIGFNFLSFPPKVLKFFSPKSPTNAGLWRQRTLQNQFLSLLSK